MHPRLPLLLLSSILTVACLVVALHATPAAAAATSCAPRACGNVTIAYPFWMPDNNQTQPSSPSSTSSPCGPQAFQVDCRVGGRATLYRSFLGGYRILRVSYDTRTLVVANDNVRTDAAGCPVPRIDVSASLSFAPFTASAANAQLLFLFNCSTGTARGGFVNVTCPGTRAVVRLDPVYNTTAARAEAGACDHSVVPVMRVPGAGAADYPRLLSGGYLLEWRASTGNCTACNASGGRCGYDADTEAFACVCADGSSNPARCDGRKSSTSKKVILIVSLLMSLAVLLAFVLLVLLKFRRQIRGFSLFSVTDGSSSDTANVEKILQKYGGLAPKRYRYSELKSITKSFEHKLGEGGYGAVFRGVLNDGGGGGQRAVAVKILQNSRPNGAEEFLNEVISIRRTSHVNVVTLLGFCLEGSTRRALVYEYMPNGSLDRYIYSSSSDSGAAAAAAALGWETLHEIAVGVARGLEYLHEGCSTRIIHFDIKPHNVLLDEEFRPKISDFGMAKLCNPKESILSMADARGTIGFIAPEVFSRGFGVVSTKSDVYSYGMLLLEMVAGRSNAKAYAENSDDLFFPLWVYDQMLEDGGVLVGLGGGGEEEIARKLALVGLWCIQTVPASRPSMSRVLEMLEKSVHELPVPPRPYHASPLNSPSPSHPSSYPSTTFASDSSTQRSRLLTPESTT